MFFLRTCDKGGKNISSNCFFIGLFSFNILYLNKKVNFTPLQYKYQVCLSSLPGVELVGTQREKRRAKK